MSKKHCTSGWKVETVLRVALDILKMVLESNFFFNKESLAIIK